MRLSTNSFQPTPIGSASEKNILAKGKSNIIENTTEVINQNLGVDFHFILKFGLN